MKRALFLFGLAALGLLAVATAATWDVSGRWVGVINVQDVGSGSEVSTPVEFQLEQNGDAITGKVGRKDDKDAANIKSGTIRGDHIEIEVVSNEIQGPAKFVLKVIAADKLEGDMAVKIEEGPIAGKVKLTRAPK